MNEYDLINAYLHLISNNKDAFLHYVFKSYERLDMMKNWLDRRNVNLDFLNLINKTNFYNFNPDGDLQRIEEYFRLDFSVKLNHFIESESNKYQVVFLSGVDHQNEVNQYFVSNQYLEKYCSEKWNVYSCNEFIDCEDLSFFGPINYFLNALYQIDKWPGVLIFKGDEWVFYPIDNVVQVDDLFKQIDNGLIFKKGILYPNDSYIIQLSDLHLGTKNKDKGKKVLQECLDDVCNNLNTNYPIKFLITGDLMNSPNRKNMYEASSFMNRLKKEYKGDVTFVLGNHDVIVHGFNLLKRQKAKVVAYLLGESIKVIENEKIILIKINSTVEGNLARGKVGIIQLEEIDDELASIENIDDYTIMVMVHHHVFPIEKDEFLKAKWHEKMFVGKIIENSKVLVDAELLIEWLKKHQIKYVFHGHKHLPFFRKADNLYVISGGSSCGGAKESKSKYLSYNVLKYNQADKELKCCFIFYEDMTKQEKQRIKVHLF